MSDLKAASPFWAGYQPGMRFSSAEVGSPEFFADVEAHRYALESHIFPTSSSSSVDVGDVLEAGCGMATDGVRFARAGARYTGIDSSPTALGLAHQRFALESLPRDLVEGSVTGLPFPDESFDLVFSHGVIHHVEDTERAVAGIRVRFLKLRLFPAGAWLAATALGRRLERAWGWHPYVAARKAG